MTLTTRKFQVRRWRPTENRFIAVSPWDADLGQVLIWSAQQRLNDGGSQFAIFDDAGTMIETEDGRLLPLFPAAQAF